MTLRRNDFLIVQRIVTLKIFAPVLAAIFLAVVAIPSSIVSASTFDGYSSIVVLFLQGIKQGLLPPGWRLIVAPPLNEFLQIYIAASLLLTLLLGSPMISFAIFNRIVPQSSNRRRLTVCSWAVFASALLAAGALSGYYVFAKFFLASITPVYVFITLFPPVMDATAFYFTVFKAIGVTAVSLTLPVYVAALIRDRRIGSS